MMKLPGPCIALAVCMGPFAEAARELQGDVELKLNATVDGLCERSHLLLLFCGIRVLHSFPVVSFPFTHAHDAAIAANRGREREAQSKGSRSERGAETKTEEARKARQRERKQKNEPKRRKSSGRRNNSSSRSNSVRSTDRHADLWTILAGTTFPSRGAARYRILRITTAIH